MCASRAAAAAALMLGGGDESHKFMGRARLDRADFASMMNPASRQIYLTFPADSTFREEDVSNYFGYSPHERSHCYRAAWLLLTFDRFNSI
jgi:hypothetical protein